MPLSRHDKLGTMFDGHRPIKTWEGNKRPKIRRNLGKLFSLSTNVFETDKDIDKLLNVFKKKYLFCVKKNCELWFTNNKVISAHVDPPQVENARSAYANAFEFGPLDLLPGKFHPFP